MSLTSIIEADLPTLEHMLRVDRPSSVPVAVYVEALVAFLSGNVRTLGELRSTLAATPATDEQHALIGELVSLRLAIRMRTIQSAELARIEALLDATSDVWRGEAAFLLGKAYEIVGELEAAMAWFAKAETWLERAGAARKAVKALQCRVAVESQIDPERRMIYEIRQVIRRAAATGSIDVEATCRMNLAREYQKVGALRVALEETNRALALLEASMPESLLYYLSLCQRADVCLDQGLGEQALRDYEEASVAPFPEVQGAVRALSARIAEAGLSTRATQSSAPSSCLPTWNERLEALHRSGRLKVKPARVADLENRLISLLADRPMSRIELAEALYGDEPGDIFAKQDRVKQMVYRLRKKNPDLIGLDRGFYHLLDARAERLC